jgi:hypothetical protein
MFFRYSIQQVKVNPVIYFPGIVKLCPIHTGWILAQKFPIILHFARLTRRKTCVLLHSWSGTNIEVRKFRVTPLGLDLNILIITPEGVTLNWKFMTQDPKRELLRHLVATIAFRGNVAVREAPAEFAGYRVAEDTRTPGEILAHIGDLLEGSLYLLKGEMVYLNADPLPWDQEVARFFAVAKGLDSFLASDTVLAVPIDRRCPDAHRPDNNTSPRRRHPR